MFHLFHGKVVYDDTIVYLEHDYFGIEVTYEGSQKEWRFFLYPHIDQTQHTIKYYAFDTSEQKKQFTQLTKIQGIWGKSGYSLAMLPPEELYTAIQDMDLQYFQKLPGIWPKTAKRIILELKQNFQKHDLWKLEIDETLYKDIIAWLKSLGYEANRVKKILPDCPIQLEKKHLPEIMKWLINHL